MRSINRIMQFFLELWTEINLKASLRARAETHPSLPGLNDSSSDATDGTIFEELVQQYEKLVTRTGDMIVQLVCTEVEVAWKTHFVRWVSLLGLSEVMAYLALTAREKSAELIQIYSFLPLSFQLSPYCRRTSALYIALSRVQT